VRGPDPEKAGCVPEHDSFCGAKMYGPLSAGVWLRLEGQ
jgi:hypothetical protein